MGLDLRKITILLIFSTFVARGADSLDFNLITYPSAHTSFESYIYKPEGKGPFPVVVWNHGHIKRLMKNQPGSDYSGIAKAFTGDGYVLFIPDRHVHDIGSKEWSADLRPLLKDKKEDKSIKQQVYFEEVAINLEDVLSALRWIKKQPYIDPNRVVLSGWSSGALQALLAAEKDSAVRACVLFSPAISTWEGNPALHAMMRRAIRNTQAPIFIIQGQNDNTLEPISALGKELEKRGGLNQTKIYPHTASSGGQAQSLAIVGWESWGYDVLTFLDKAFELRRNDVAITGKEEAPKQ